MTTLTDLATETLRLDAERGSADMPPLSKAAAIDFLSHARTAAPRMARALLAILPAIERLRREQGRHDTDMAPALHAAIDNLLAALETP